jgi:hypothetical protein
VSRMKLTLVLLLVSCSSAAARAGDSILDSVRLVTAGSDTFSTYRLPSPKLAAAISTNTTLIALGLGGGLVALDAQTHPYGNGAAYGIIVGTLGVIVGPSTGYFYGDMMGRGLGGALLRTALIVGPPLAWAYSGNSSLSTEDSAFELIGAVSIGLTAAIVSAAWDCATVDRTVERSNRAQLRATSLELVPCVAPTTGAPALALRMHFGTPPPR